MEYLVLEYPNVGLHPRLSTSAFFTTGTFETAGAVLEILCGQSGGFRYAEHEIQVLNRDSGCAFSEVVKTSHK